MTHKWLTAENVELLETMLKQMGMIPEGDAKRLIADWREMLSLIERLAAVRIVDELPEAAAVWNDVSAMLVATGDD